MTISDELRQYINRWICLTGHAPTAMPVTDIEAHELYCELSDMGVRFAPCLGRVPEFLGVDMYITPDAKQRRDAIKEKA